jgi:hypothetical protein
MLGFKISDLKKTRVVLIRLLSYKNTLIWIVNFVIFKENWWFYVVVVVVVDYELGLEFVFFRLN